MDVAGKLIAGVVGGMDKVMGAHEAREGGGSQAEGTQVVDSFVIGLGLAKVNEALDRGADEIDLGLEVDGGWITYVLGGGSGAGGIKAMLTGILVTGLATATTFGRG